MKKTYEIPKLDMLCLDVEDTLTADMAESLSGMLDYGEDVEEW